jgi:hypothetical protein
MSGLIKNGMDSKTATLLKGAEACLETGRVAALDPLAVELTGRVSPARRAKSCLVVPEVGDRVLCAIDGESVFVLSVLEGSGALKLAVDGDLEIASREGRVALKGAQGVDVAGKELNLVGRKGTLAFEELGLLGRVLRVDIDKAVLVAREVDSLCERVLSRARRVLRLVETQDVTRAGSVEVKAEKSFVVRGDSCVVAARRVAKVDGAQVKIG